ncbi:single-stranded DNA-binding protein [Paracoccus sp. DMF-8]|uniref:single-stranded DNA-binding protein n=1 Tax=Paracoccus sp. DMF-8 TaxID=3019445 RepID=UPI0023E3CC4E|nr:single-stranded DNA-binding protein [Paracoccus sp. DMF-8]MDF3607513.1 single-stranded DNA-binding protein [Paracoccus sp. DMF-8]
MKNITIAGRITRDAVTRTTQQGDKVTGFSVAVDDGFGQNKRTLFFDCSLWGKRGESLSQYLMKGASVTVAGDLSTREHEGKTYLTIRVSEITLQGGKSGGGSRDDDQRGNRQQSSQSGGYAGGTTGGAPDFDDDIPF